ncbi:Rmf/CrpP family protein [Idiomarina sp.]|uniref:ribosome modulation factor n=1 Tax=Idiomarina sp. TaxID=1874361 RepID=UPI00258CFC0B|nr:Rmf/CrpP family protein [Idiomarina sp.]
MSENEAKTPAQQGWSAFRNGKSMSFNPYSYDDKARTQWLNGWERACKGYDEPKSEGLELVK